MYRWFSHYGDSVSVEAKYNTPQQFSNPNEKQVQDETPRPESEGVKSYWTD